MLEINYVPWLDSKIRREQKYLIHLSIVVGMGNALYDYNREYTIDEENVNDSYLLYEQGITRF